MALEVEKKLIKEGYKFIAGIDEAGRGPLAGPVVAAAVILPSSLFFAEGNLQIADSKKLSARQREKSFQIIKKQALEIGIGIVDNKIIDRINILQASLLAMRKAFLKLKNRDYLLADGPYVPFPGKEMNFPQRAIIKGDVHCLSIAAASIIAKVVRDRLMEKYSRVYPQYNFNQHKGYPTKAHKQTILKYGLCPLHRRSFQFREAE